MSGARCAWRQCLPPDTRLQAFRSVEVCDPNSWRSSHHYRCRAPEERNHAVKCRDDEKRQNSSSGVASDSNHHGARQRASQRHEYQSDQQEVGGIGIVQPTLLQRHERHCINDDGRQQRHDDLPVEQRRLVSWKRRWRRWFHARTITARARGVTPAIRGRGRRPSDGAHSGR